MSANRWSGRELADLDQQAQQSQLPGADPIVAAFADNCSQLITEVCRLRGLLMLGVEVVVYSEMQNPGGMQAWEAAVKEARAIREEQGRADRCQCEHVRGDGRPDGYRGGVMRNVNCPIHGDPMARKS